MPVPRLFFKRNIGRNKSVSIDLPMPDSLSESGYKQAGRSGRIESNRVNISCRTFQDGVPTCSAVTAAEQALSDSTAVKFSRTAGNGAGFINRQSVEHFTGVAAVGIETPQAGFGIGAAASPSPFAPESETAGVERLSVFRKGQRHRKYEIGGQRQFLPVPAGRTTAVDSSGDHDPVPVIPLGSNHCIKPSIRRFNNPKRVGAIRQAVIPGRPAFPAVGAAVNPPSENRRIKNSVRSAQ